MPLISSARISGRASINFGKPNGEMYGIFYSSVWLDGRLGRGVFIFHAVIRCQPYKIGGFVCYACPLQPLGTTGSPESSQLLHLQPQGCAQVDIELSTRSERHGQE